MSKTTKKLKYGQARSMWLLIFLLVFSFVSPLLRQGSVSRIVFDVMVFTVLLTAISAIARHPKQLKIGVFLIVPIFLLRTITFIYSHSTLVFMSEVAALPFFVFMIVTLFMYALSGDRVTMDKLFATFCIYLFIAVTWAFLYRAVEFLVPNSFTVADGSIGEAGLEIPQFVYFSLVTLTTLGYGDITPVSSYARSLATLEAISGVFFIATFVARLTGLYRRH